MVTSKMRETQTFNVIIVQIIHQNIKYKRYQLSKIVNIIIEILLTKTNQKLTTR